MVPRGLLAWVCACVVIAAGVAWVALAGERDGRMRDAIAAGRATERAPDAPEAMASAAGIGALPPEAREALAEVRIGAASEDAGDADVMSSEDEEEARGTVAATQGDEPEGSSGLGWFAPIPVGADVGSVVRVRAGDGVAWDCAFEPNAFRYETISPSPGTLAAVGTGLLVSAGARRRAGACRA